MAIRDLGRLAPILVVACALCACPKAISPKQPTGNNILAPIRVSGSNVRAPIPLSGSHISLNRVDSSIWAKTPQVRGWYQALAILPDGTTLASTQDTLFFCADGRATACNFACVLDIDS